MIDLLALYTKNASIDAPDLYTRIVQFIADANASYAQNQIPLTVRLVGISPLAYTESGDLQTDLANLTASSNGNVQAMRVLASADLVALFEGTNTASANFAATDFSQPNPFGQMYNAFMVVKQSLQQSAAFTQAIDNTLGSPTADPTVLAANGPIVAAYRTYQPFMNDETFTTRHIEGWAFDPRAFSTPSKLRVAIDGQTVATFTADIERDDVNAQYAGGNHGFSYDLPVLSEGNHTITVYEQDAITSAILCRLIPKPSPSRPRFSTKSTTPEEQSGCRGGHQRRCAEVFTNPPDYDPQFQLSRDILNALAVESYYGGDDVNSLPATVHLTAWQHFLLAGQYEGRDPSAYFDTALYLADNPDVATAYADLRIASPFDHYETTGQIEDRTASVYFDPHFYRLANPDVNRAIIANPALSAIEHFLLAGQY